MTVFTATRGAATRASAAAGLASSKITAWGTIEVTTIPVAADIYQMCKLPKGAVILGGRLLGNQLGSGTSFGSTCLTLNIGVDCAITLPNGTAVTTASTSTALGVLTPEGTAQPWKTEVGYNQPLGGLLISDGPFTLGDNATVQMAVATVVGAGSFTTGTLTLEVDYYMGSHS